MRWFRVFVKRSFRLLGVHTHNQSPLLQIKHVDSPDCDFVVIILFYGSLLRNHSSYARSSTMIHLPNDADPTIAALREAAAAAGKTHLAGAAEWDEQAFFPRANIKELAMLGFMGLTVSEAHGGMGLGRAASIAMFEELGQHDPSTAAFISIHSLVGWALDRLGTAEQRRAYLQPLLDFDLVGAYALTEPNHGSDAANLRTTARKAGGDYVLNGTKAFTSGGGVSDLYLLFARTGEDGPGGISAFLIPKDTPGLSFGAQERKMGWRSQPTSMVMLDDCRIPAAALLGEENRGFRIAMQALDGGRLNISAVSLGGAVRAIGETTSYVQQRKQFDKPLAAFQALQFRIADMVTETLAARLMLEAAARRFDANHADTKGTTAQIAAAKAFVTEHAYGVVDEALQLHGGYGYLKDFPIERIARDLRVHRILEGTSEIMRTLVARHSLM